MGDGCHCVDTGHAWQQWRCAVVDEVDSDDELLESDVEDPFDAPEDWSTSLDLPHDWLPSLGVILLSSFLTLLMLGIGLGQPSIPTPNADNRLHSPAQYERRFENVRIEVDIPRNWETTYSYPYSLSPQLELDVMGETQLSPKDTPQSDPSGLTISHFYSASNQEGDWDYGDSPRKEEDTHDKNGLQKAGRRLPDIQNPQISTDVIDQRSAVAVDYSLTSPHGRHECTERHVEVNQETAILRLCGPAGSNEIPQEYQNVLSSIRWIPREYGVFPQSDISIDVPKEKVDIPLPQGWENRPQPENRTDTVFHPSYVDFRPSRLAGGALTIRHFPTSAISGEQGLYPTVSPAAVCSPEWKKMADTWDEGGAQNWLKDRTIGGRKACGYSRQGYVKEYIFIHYWFVAGADGLWVFTVTDAPEDKESKHAKTSPRDTRYDLSTTDTAQANALLDQVTWVRTDGERGITR
ncbi:MAG: hypothetical protein Q4C87_11890 [Actinomycetaceae bacterium]|nr:hypothetical protein [Actinomycetaceae bacterium]